MPTWLFEQIMSMTGGLTTTGMLLRIGLLSCSVVAVVHLITLWGTKYGDHNTMSKSLFLSLVLHGCFGLGWATVAESYPRKVVGEVAALDETPVNFIDNVDSAPVEGLNKLPIFYQGTAASGVTVTRDANAPQRLDFETTESVIESPQIEKMPRSAVPDQPVPDLVGIPEEQQPALERPVDNSPKSIASSPLSIDQPAKQASPEASVRVPAIRSSISRPTDSIEAPMTSGGPPGTSTTPAPSIADEQVAPFETELTADALPKPQGPSSDVTVRRPGVQIPLPAPIVDPAATVGSTSNLSPSGSAISRRPSRRTTPSTLPGNGNDDITVRPSMASAPSSGANRNTSSRTLDAGGLPGAPYFEPGDETVQPNLERPRAPSVSRMPARAPETYQARSTEQRMSSVLRNGGSEESEQAVEKSLKWLANVQESDGRWSPARHGGGTAREIDGISRVSHGATADSGITGLVILSFLGAGYNHETGPYTTNVRKALDWLIEQQDPASGYLSGKAIDFERNYCHAIATFALAEAYAMQRDASDFPELGRSVRRAVVLITQLQNNDGGWRYNVKGDNSPSDMSMFGWQLMALKSAVNGGISVPEKTRRKMVEFLDTRGRGKHKGLAGYREDARETPAMTAEALFCRQMFTVRANDAASMEAVDYLMKNLPRASIPDEYYWYYGTLAMRQVGGEPWEKWNDALRDMLISMQRQQGPLAGSWNPDGKWARVGGRLYSTALRTMCLEAYYRYQTNSKPASSP